MKNSPHNPLLARCLATGLTGLIVCSGIGHAAEILYKSTATSTAEATTANNWGGGVVPGAGDIAAWTTAGTNGESRGGVITVASPVSWLGIRHEDSSGGLTLTGSTITLGASGITEVRWEPLAIQNNLILGAEQGWNIGNATTVTGAVSGIGGITKTGTGTLIMSGANTFTGSIGVQNGTLRMSSLSSSGGVIALGGAGNQGTLILDGSTGFSTDRSIDLAGTTGGATITRDGLGLISFNGVATATGAGAKGVTINGSGNLQFTGFQSNGGLTNITKSGIGTLTFTGTSFQGGGAMNLNGGVLSFASSAISTGGTFNRNSTGGGVLKVAAGASIATGSANTNGILGAWATYGGNTWAVANGASAISGLSTFASNAWAAGNNTDVTLAGTNPAAASTTHSLRFNEAGAKTLTLSGVNTLSSGGIMVTGNVGNNVTSITGGNLITGSAGGDFVINQFNTANTLTIGSIIGAAPQSLASTTTAASTTVTVPSSANLYVGMAVTGTGIPANSSVASIVDGTTITLNNAATAAGTPSLAYATNSGLTLTGAGTTVLTGANTYNGNTTILEGILEVQARGAGSENYIIAKEGTLRFGHSVSGGYTAGVTVNGGGTAATTGLYLQGGTNINWQNSGGLVLSTAATTVRTYGTGNAVLSGFDTNTTHLTVNAAASGSVLASTIDFAPGSYGYVMNIAAGSNTATGDVTFQGKLTGAINANGTYYRKTGTGSLLLSGASTNAAPVDIRDGSVILSGGNDRLGVGSSVNLGNGTTSGKLVLNGISQTLVNITTTGTGTANKVVGGSATASTLTLNNGTDQSFAGTLGGTGTNENNFGLVKNGTGTYTLTGANTYTGNTTVNGGVLEVLGKGAGSANYIVGTGGTLRLGYNVVNSYTIGTTVNGSGMAATTGLALQLGRNINFQNNGGLVLSTAPTTIRTYGTGANAILSGFDNNSTHLTVNAAASGSVFVSTIDFSPSSYGYVMNVAAGDNTATGDVTIQGTLTGAMNANGTHYRKTGTGSLQLTGASTNTAPVDIRGGSVILSGGDNRLGVGSSVNLGNGTGSGKLILNGINQTLASVTTTGTGTANAIVGGSATQSKLIVNYTGGTPQSFTGSVGGSGTNENNISVETIGTGVFTFAGNNTYSGGTTVSSGTLRVNGVNTSTGAYNVSSGATFGGTGSVSGAVNVSGVLAPGASIESLATGSLAMLAGSTLSYELSNAGALGADLVAVTGDFSLTGLVSLDLIGAGTWSAGDKLTLVSYTGLWNGGLLTYNSSALADDSTFAFDGQSWTINYNDALKGANFAADANGTYVTMTAIPEPETMLLGSLALLTLFRRRR